MDSMLFVCRHHIALVGCVREEGEVWMVLFGKEKDAACQGKRPFYYCKVSFGMEPPITWLQNQSLVANVLKTRQRQSGSSLVIDQLEARRITV